MEYIEYKVDDFKCGTILGVAGKLPFRPNRLTMIGLLVAKELRSGKKREGGCMEVGYPYSYAKSLKGQMKIAGKSGLLYTLILDETNTSRLRNMSTGTQTDINIALDVVEIAENIRVAMAAEVQDE